MAALLDIGSPFTLTRKNTFLEVVSLEQAEGPSAPRCRSAMSEPSRSRETTPEPGFKGWKNGSYNEMSNCNTPVLDTRDLNQAPMWSTDFQQCWTNEAGTFGGDPNSDWANYGEDCQVFYPGQQWICYDQSGQPMQVTFVPFEGGEGCYTEGFDGCQVDMDIQSVPTTANGETQRHSSAGSDSLDFNEQLLEMDDIPAPRRFNRDGTENTQFPRDKTERAKDKKDKKRKPRLPKTSGGKVFVGGLASKTTEETLMKIFSQFGPVAQANILLDPQSRRSRGFGYISFAGEVPESVSDRDHLIDGRLCGARIYKY